jgi:hypothetical protein
MSRTDLDNMLSDYWAAKMSHEWRRMSAKRDAIREKVDEANYRITEAQYAVYFAPGWESWQKFRISLKGDPIAEKLTRLEWYLKSSDYSNEEYIRVSNYLGALLRGGFEEARPMFKAIRGGDI